MTNFPLRFIIIAMSREHLPKRDFITKEIFILVIPFLASYLWTIFYEAGYAEVFSIPFELIEIRTVDILLTNRLTLLAATLAFLWIGLYYNLLPSAQSPLFKGFVTLTLIVVISLGFSFGRYEASHRKIFPVLHMKNQNAEAVVLKIYADKIIIAPFDRQSRKIKNEFQVLNLGKDDLVLKLEAVGPLETKK